MFRTLSQIIAVVEVDLRTMPRRAGASMVAVVGIAGVVIVLVSMLSMAQGFTATMSAAGDPRTAVVMRSGSGDEMSSTILREHVAIVEDAPGVLRPPGGPLASPEFLVIVNLPKKSTGTDANVALRGVGPQAFALRGGWRIVEGRRFEPGRNEIIVGRAVQRQFRGLGVGGTARWGMDVWTVVGGFEAGGGVAESEIWCDVFVLQSAFRRGSNFRSVRVRLESPESFAPFKNALTADPRLNVMVVREPDYYAEQSHATSRLITTIGYGVVALMAMGAIFGAVNTMYTAVAARTREIATLRALGFGAGPVVASVLIESALLALAGGVLGALAAWTVFDGYQTSTLNWQSFSQVAFVFSVTPRLVAHGVLSAVALGLVGGLPPAIHAVRIPIAAALRES